MKNIWVYDFVDLYAGEIIISNFYAFRDFMFVDKEYSTFSFYKFMCGSVIANGIGE